MRRVLGATYLEASDSVSLALSGICGELVTRSLIGPELLCHWIMSRWQVCHVASIIQGRSLLFSGSVMDHLQVPEMSEELQTPPNLEPAILLKLRLLCKH